MNIDEQLTIAVVVPCFRVAGQILDVLSRIGPEVEHVYVVDDACPEGSGDLVQARCADPRVVVIRNPVNLGVGGAVIAGYRRAIADGATVVVKIDGDGQMLPELIPQFVAPIAAGLADYTKGNRFYDLTKIQRMPRLRIFGNAVLSLMAKVSTGYWQVFDPTNGFTAIHARVAATLPLEKIASRYFFETDVLFRLNAIRAVVLDIPMDANYGAEKSGLRIRSVAFEFAARHVGNAFKRVFYNYFLRDMSVASIELVVGVLLLGFALVFGGAEWIRSYRENVAAPTGTVMLAALPALLGVQFLLAFVSYDVAQVPRQPLHPLLRLRPTLPAPESERDRDRGESGR